MTTIFQLATALLNECIKNPEVANYGIETMDDIYNKALSNKKTLNKPTNLSKVQLYLYTIDECHCIEKTARKELSKQIIKYGSILFHNIQFKDYDTRTVALYDVRTGGVYMPNMYGVCMNIDDGSYIEL